MICQCCSSIPGFVAFGRLRLLEQLIEVRVAADDSLIQNEEMFSLISQANGGGYFAG
jgi:hypothetical protein